MYLFVSVPVSVSMGKDPVLTAPASIKVPVGVSTNAGGSRLPGTGLSPHSVL